MTIDGGSLRLECNISYAGGSSPGLNVWHAQVTDATRVADANTIIGQLHTFYEAIKALLPSSCTVTAGSKVVAISDNTFVAATPQVTTGTGGSVLSPPLLCVVGDLLTANASRSGRGRVFLGPWIQTTIQTDGTVLDTTLSTLRTALAAIPTTTTQPYIGVYSKKLNTIIPLTGTRIYDRWGVLRSRR